MDLGMIGALALLVIWAVVALVFEGPGWIHLLLTLGVSLLIYRIVARSSTLDDAPPAPRDPPR